VQSIDIAKRNKEFDSTQEMMNRVNGRMSTPGSVKERQANAKNAVKIEDIFETQSRSASDVATFTGLVDKITKVKNNLEQVKKSMYEKGLEQEHKIMNEWIDRIGARKEGSVDTNKVYSAIRKAYTAGAIGLRASTSLIQEVSAFNYLTTVDGIGNKARMAAAMPKLVAQSNLEVAKAIKDPNKGMEYEMNLSPMIRERIESAQLDRDLGEGGSAAEARRNIRKLANRKGSRKVKGAIKTESGFAPITFFDTIAIKAIVKAARLHTKMEGVYDEGTQAFENSVKEKAEKAIRQTQPTFDETDKSEILTNPILKELTMFASQRSKLANMSVRAMHKIKTGKVADGVADLAYVSLFVSASITAIKSIWKKLKGDDEDKEVLDYVKEMAGSYASNIPVAGTMLDAAIQGKDIRLPGVILNNGQTFLDLGRALNSGDEEKILKQSKRALQTLGVPVAVDELREVGVNLMNGGN
jgi:ribosomal protein L19